MPVKFPQFRPRRDAIPDKMWTRCPSCEEQLFNKHLEKAMNVCPSCGHHFRLPATVRLGQLLDEGTFEERDQGLVSLDPLGFVDQKPYPDRLAAAQLATGLKDAAIWGFGRLDGRPVAILVMDFGFMGGSMGAVVGEKVARAAEGALAQRVPLVIVSASGGARMQEGTLALMQLAKTMAALERLRAAGVPFISVMSDPTTGGVFASFAAMGDVNLAEPNALIGFAGARVGAGTIGQELPPGFQRAEFLYRHGFVDRVVARPDLRRELAQLLRYLAPAREEAPVVDRFLRRDASPEAPEPVEPATPADLRAENWARVQLARNLRRPRILELLAVMAEDVIELHGDRVFGDDEAIVAGFATFDGRRVAVVGQQKGADTEENVRRSFGMPHPEGYRKAMRVMELAERSGLPVVTFVDVPGAHPGPESEERGIAEAIARSVGLMTRLRTPIVTVITGEGGSGGALAIAVGDVVLALENAVYSVISPEGCASILWRTTDEAATAALAMRMSAQAQHELGVVDEVIDEPPEGAHTDPAETGRRLKAAIVRELDRLAAIPIDTLVEQRYRRYRALGPYGETVAPAQTPVPPPRPGLADRLRGLFEAGQRAIPAPLPVGRRQEPPAREDV